jgi:CDP-glucose 4,6-dehydratase
VEGVGVTAFAGRPVLVTGHTGFKGAWLCLWLRELGAEVHGFSLPPPTAPSLYADARLGELLASEALADVRDAAAVEGVVRRARPEVVFHLAAQPLVRRSYREPRATWETNVLGTVNVLEAVRTVPGVRVCQVITSDKCYENPSQVCAFRETDPMGGHDPYSASKGAAELAVAAWRRSFFPPDRVAEHGVSLSSARAGNVIGGGDWAEDRILPDCVRALARGEPVPVRNPAAVRPWQHVLEPLSGYLRLAARQLDEPRAFADGFNFGPPPAGNLTVGAVADLVVRHWGAGRWEHRPAGTAGPRDRLHEAAFLKLDITKATTLLDWRPLFTPEEAIAATVAWYRRRHSEDAAFDARAACRRQIADYQQRQAAA